MGLGSEKMRWASPSTKSWLRHPRFLHILITIITITCNVFRFTSAATANVAESANIGDTIYTAAATDADTDQTVTYTLSATSAVFQLDGSSGKQEIKFSYQDKNKPVARFVHCFLPRKVWSIVRWSDYFE